MTVDFKAEFLELKDRLHQSLYDHAKNHKTPRQRLEDQAETLDLLFYNLLSHVAHYIDPETGPLRAALRAQNQCRYTLKALDANPPPSQKT